MPNNCQNLLETFLEGDPPHKGSTILVTMVTLDNRGIATYTRTRLYYFAGSKIPNGPEIAGRYKTDPKPGEFAGGVSKGDWGWHCQIFSNRFVGHPGEEEGITTSYQRFDKDQPDSLDMEITVTPVARVKIRFRDQGDAIVEFEGVCSDAGFPIGLGEPRQGGFLVGATAFAKYVMFISPFTHNPDK